jgi:hypothetical protein
MDEFIETPHSRLIDALGGTVAAARVFEVRPQAVSQWRRQGIPKPRMMFLALLRPDLNELIDAARPEEAIEQPNHAA